MGALYRIRRQQNGSTLFIALTFLVVITLMGLSGMQTATLQERMAGSERDYSIALQAAEMALRDAEHDLLGVDYNNAAIPGISDAGASCQANSVGRVCFEVKKQTSITVNKPSRPLQSTTGYGPSHELWTHTCQWGQCYISMNSGSARPAVLPVWTDQSVWSTDVVASTPAATASSVSYGAMTGAPALAMPQQPRYILEAIDGTGSVATPASATGSTLSFRITARAVGLNPRTIVLLQEVFQCSSC